MLLSTVHCMFMLTCFGSKLSGGAYELICPSGCDCYSAAPDGMSGNNSVSVICDRPEPLYSYTSFRWTQINTLIIRLTKVHSKDFTPIPKTHLALSFILDQCEMGTLSESRNIFQLLNAKFLNYLTILNTSLKGINWTILNKFEHLRAIYIEQSTLETLEGTFASIISPNLHTISIKESKLIHIDREAFAGKENTLQRLTITQNEINNFVWLSANGRRWLKLWYLDLRFNKLTYIPDNLRFNLPNLEVFYLSNNNIKYLSSNSLDQWFSISEFMLAEYSQTSKRIYYTEEMKNLKDLLNQNPPAFELYPAFFLESMKDHLGYDCMNSKNHPEMSLDPFGSLKTCDELIHLYTRVYTYWPDNLHLNHQGQLTVGKPVTDNENLKVVQIEGTDFNSYMTTVDKPELFIDTITNIAEYRAAREEILTQLNNQMNGNSIRLNLFGPSTFAYLKQPANVLRPNALISLWIDFLEDILSNAEVLNKYVFLVIFKYEHFDFNAIDFSKTQMWLDTKLGDTFNEMMPRLDAKSSLIGIEVVSGFLTGANIPVPSTANNCPTDLDNQLIAIHSTVHFIKRKLKDKLVGINIDANCQYCLHGAMLKECQMKGISNQMPSNQVSFISITSHLNELNLEIYSHKNWFTNVPAFFKDYVVETVLQDAKRPIKPGVFFILKDDGRGMNVHEAKTEIAATTAAGVFVIPLKISSASSDLLGETIVRQ